MPPNWIASIGKYAYNKKITPMKGLRMLGKTIGLKTLMKKIN